MNPACPVRRGLRRKPTTRNKAVYVADSLWMVFGDHFICGVIQFLSPGYSAPQYLEQSLEIPVQIGTLGLEFCDLSAGMQNGRVITAAECFANVGQT